MTTTGPTASLLGDVAAFSSGKSVKPGGTGAYPVLGSNGPIGRTDEPIHADAVVLGRVGAYCGSVALAEGKFWASDNTIVCRPKSGALSDLRFLAYMLEAMKLNRLAGGAAQPLLTQKVLKPLEVPWPSATLRREIADALRGFDDLIENNRRRIEVLEEIARLVYREWFVHFRFPGHEDVDLVDSELGPIPEGWEVRPLGELLAFEIGGGWGQEEPTSDEPAIAAVIRGTDIPRARRLDVSKCPVRFHKVSALKKRVLEAGDLVIEVSGGSKGQPVGRPLLVSAELLDSLGGEVICASFCKLARPDPEAISSQLLFLHLLCSYESGGLDQHQVQSTGITNLKWKPFLAGYRIAVPGGSVQERFENLVCPMRDLIGNLGSQNAVLLEARDLLLPRLVSGELDVSELDLDGVLA